MSVIPANAGIQLVGLTALKINLDSRLRGNDVSSMMQPCVYILASGRNGTLYVGVTSDLIKRIWQHKEKLAEGFTNKYGVHMLVWFEQHETMDSAIAREKAIKKWNRAWKLKTIESMNPVWRDLYTEIL